MNFDFSDALRRIRDARSKRKKVSDTKKFFDTLRHINIAMPVFDANKFSGGSQLYVSARDDDYSNALLQEHGPLDTVQGRVAKMVTGNGNCLFNSASLALIGKCKMLHIGNCSTIIRVDIYVT